MLTISAAKANTQAVTPEPQVIIMAFLSVLISVNISANSSGDFNRPCVNKSL
jgi:hypothetical protein